MNCPGPNSATADPAAEADPVVVAHPAAEVDPVVGAHPADGAVPADDLVSQARRDSSDVKLGIPRT